MTNFVFQFTSILIAVIGLLLIFIELRTRFDRSFLYFGINTLLLCAFSFVDIWIIPHTASAHEYLYWARVQHVIFAPIPLFLAWYLMILTRSFHLRIVKGLAFLALAFSVLSFSDLMLTVENGACTTGILYNVLFAPFVVFFLFFIVGFIIVKYRKSPPPEKKILRYHFIGFTLLGLCGFYDMFTLMGLTPQFLPSTTILGVLVFAGMTTLVFAERLLQLIRERERTFNKLQSAYVELEQASNLKTLGRSTAIINHEIKNYLFHISGMAELLEIKEPMSPEARDLVRTMKTSIDELESFSSDILELSKVQILKDKNPINISQLVCECARKHFPRSGHLFRFTGVECEQFIHGDWGKLEHVFVNIFKNSIEARAGVIEVKVIPGPCVLLITVEDDGLGCDEAQLPHLFEAFYTTKTGTYGTGLGMSIGRTIVRSHGGQVSAYSKNLLGPDHRGLILNITLPIYDETPQEADEKQSIVLIKEGFENLAPIIQVFQNVRVTPHVVQSIPDLVRRGLDRKGMKILANTKSVDELSRTLGSRENLALLSCRNNVTYIFESAADDRPRIFSEEYVLSTLLAKSA